MSQKSVPPAGHLDLTVGIARSAEAGPEKTAKIPHKRREAIVRTLNLRDLMPIQPKIKLGDQK
jgi:hypothetical protein